MVEFGLSPNLYPVETIYRAAELCERESIDLWLADHVVAVGVRNFAALEAFTTLSALAVKTSKIRLGTCVSDPHRRHPETLAQMVATLDHISRGRAILGLGAGESMNLDPFGVPWDHPVSRLEEAVQIIKLLWTKDQLDFDGRFFKLRKAILDLKPIQKPHPPIWIAGNSPRSLRITARWGDGWLPVMDPGRYSSMHAELMDLMDRMGRSSKELSSGAFIYTATAPTLEQLEREFLLIARLYWLTFTDPRFNFIKVPWNRELGLEWLNRARSLDLSIEYFREHGLNQGLVIDLPEGCILKLERYIEAGANYMLLVPLTRPEKFAETAQIYIDEVIPSLK